MRVIRKVALLGAGTMGAQIAAHFANAQTECLLLDQLPPSLSAGEEKKGLTLDDPKVRNRYAQTGLDTALKARPAAFFVPESARLISVGNFEDDLERLRDCDWIIEAVTEDLAVKRALLAKIRPFVHQAIISSNTSGISLASIARDLDEDFKSRWLGTHFFNPPRYMKLLEIIPTAETLPEVVKQISRFGDDVLGKGVVRAKDTPNFIANRIGTFVMALTLRLMQELDFSIEEVDALTGPVLGLPKSATFRLLDLVGLDVLAHVARNFQASLPAGDERDVFQLPGFVEQMIERGLLGEKTRQGFYKKTLSGPGKESEILTLDLRTFEYRPRQKPRLPALEMAGMIEDARQRVKSLFELSGRPGEFYQKLLGRVFHYAASLIPEISEDLVSVDCAMKWGFNWECGVFEISDAIGIEKVVNFWQLQNLSPPPLVQRLQASGEKSFYSHSNGSTMVFDLRQARPVILENPPGVLLLFALKDQAREITKNAGASLIDLGDGVLCLEFHSKMNTIGPDTVAMIHAGLKRLSDDFEALVLGNQGANFSAGANLMLLLLAIQEGDWDEIHDFVRGFQRANMALKYAPKPVVAAPFGLTLGGGLEISLHCHRMTAAAEAYMGLVETGVGLIPAGGGLKEMLVRATYSAPLGENADPFHPIRQIFENIGMAKVSTSAEEGRKLGYLSACDMISMNRDHQLAAAKRLALELASQGYRPGKPREDIPVLGQSAYSKMRLGLHLMRRAEYITDHDAKVG
ncbi:MAG TPA: 3-hydroxyacyl-CoA dehydrogenase/enoyl-CoA hydratase family protein, partial [Terriglobia bacterium]|nr:3-hydroxyacyl-CoA dehydrogenase/enoyl-CoA hydratase family protein [Terriglobia bacterium]